MYMHLPSVCFIFIYAFRYFLDQNDAIAKGAIKGIHLKLKVLGIGNGLTVSAPVALINRN
jgi:hypothetical protein